MRKSFLLGSKSEEVVNKRIYTKELNNLERIIAAKKQEIQISEEELTDRFHNEAPISEAEILTLYGQAIYNKKQEVKMFESFKETYYSEK